MSEEHNYHPKRERTPKRRSSILKRQDTCLITEDGDEGSRTPRRVSFAKNTMIKEFYAIPWPSHDDSSLQSSKSSHSSSSSNETHHSTLSEEYGKDNLSKHHSLSAQPGRPTFMQISETESHYQGLQSSEQNRTIHFQDLDSSIGNMNLTSNITELSMSTYSTEKAFKVMPWLHREQQLDHEEHGRREIISASYRMQECITMEMTQNLHGANMDDTNRTYQRQLSDECTEDMELTADLMYTSRSALIDIPVNKTRVNAPTGAAHTAVKFGRGAEEQENNPLLLLHSLSSTAQDLPQSPSAMNSSNMELTNIIKAASPGNNIYDTLQTASGVAGTCSIQSSVAQCEERQRQRLTDQLTSQVLSPVAEMSGLNFSQASSLQNRTCPAVSPNQRGSLKSSSSRPQLSIAGTNTVYFGSPSATETERDSGNIELTKNITCNIENNGNLHQALTLDQCQESGGSQPNSNMRLNVEPQTKTIYFNSFDAVGTSNMMENAGDMELTATCCDLPMNSAPSQHSGELRLSEPSSEAQAGTVYFDNGGEAGRSGEMELTEAVQDAEDLEIVFNFTRLNSGSSQSELGPRISEVKNTEKSKCSPGFSNERKLFVDRDEKVHQNQESAEPHKLSASIERNIPTGSKPKDIGTQQAESFSSKSNQWESASKLEHKDTQMKKTHFVKNNIIKDLNGFLNFSRRSSVSNKNILNARRSLGGLLLSSQEKSKRKSNTLFPKLYQTGQDEVDGMEGSLAQNDSCNKMNSSEIISIFSAAESPLCNSKNSLSTKSIGVENNSPLKENILTNSSTKDQSLPLSELITRSPITLQSPPGKDFSSCADINKSSHTVSAPPELEPSMATVGRESPIDYADLKDNPGVPLEDLNLHKLVGNCDVDEEALDDFLQNLSGAELQAPQTEELVTLEDIYSTVGFDDSGDSETISFEKEIQIASKGSKLQTKVAAVPKLDSLEGFVQDMESAVNKLKEENLNKQETVSKDLAEVARLLVTDEEKTKSSALEMCQACRMLARSQWWKQEAGHLIEYSTQREESFERLNTDVELFRQATERCSDLANEIDKCLQEINGIQDMTKDLEHEERKLAGVHRELADLKLQSNELDKRTATVQKKSSELVDSTETVVAGQERVKEQLWWMESLTEWTLLEETSQGMTFGFLFNTLVLQVQLERSSGEGLGILGISLRSRLSASSKPWAKLSHGLAIASIDCKALESKYNSRNQLSKLLLDVASVVCNCRQLSTEIRQAHFSHRVSIKGSTLEVYIIEGKRRQKICLRTQFEAPCTYPNTKLCWAATTLFGDAQSEAIMEVASQEPTGYNYLTRVLAAVQKSLSHSAR